ncbi:hypothetical protein [Streptomyces sp. DW26H14]|uniref:hypothetical protein n=1 Tax=Streptomyces sp. DW26H14 TaxID=3435395 RepID=UPI00403DDFCE
MHPANLLRRLSDRCDDARQTGDRVQYADARGSFLDGLIARAVDLGIPHEYIDPTTGGWDVPETVCWRCWKAISGPVVALGINAGCRHYHPACRKHDALLRRGVHGRPSCKSSIPHYEGDS